MLQIKHSSTETTEKRQEYHAKLAGLYIQLQQPEDAKKHLEPLLHGKHAYSDSKSRLHAACQMADVRVGMQQTCIQLDCCTLDNDALRRHAISWTLASVVSL